MKAELTYSIINATLEQGMYVLHENKLAFISRFCDDSSEIAYYYEKDGIMKCDRFVCTKQQVIDQFSSSVIKLIAIVDNNPISVNHASYRKVFGHMVYLSSNQRKNLVGDFIATKKWNYPIVGTINPVYSMLSVGDEVTVYDLNTIDKYELYSPEKRAAKISKSLKRFRYEIKFHFDDKLKAVVHREGLVRCDSDKYNLFDVMDFSDVKALLDSGAVKPVAAKKSSEPRPVRKDENAFYRIAKSDWHADYLIPKGETEYKWVAVNDKTQEVYPISIPINKIPRYQFSDVNNEYWLPGTIREVKDPKADMKNFVPYRRGLPVFGEVVTTTLCDKSFTYFLLDNIKQESVNRFIYKHRDVTEERRSELTLRKLPKL